VETPDLFELEPDEPERGQATAAARQSSPYPRAGTGVFAAGHRIGWIAGLVLALSSFMSWYSGRSLEGPTLAVVGWHTGAVGKLVFFVGLAVLVLAVLREAGVELPPAVPESLVVIALGALGTILVLVRVISIPDTFAGTSGRAIGIWIALAAALAVIVAGLLRAGEEL
jgi:hypothetical protein